MISDAFVVVTCDNCSGDVEVELQYVYRTYSGDSGYYNSDETAIEKSLEKNLDWIVDDGHHFCCRICQGEWLDANDEVWR